jgi:DNA primase
VKVLQIRDAKDPDEFLKKFGADRFKLLLEDSANRVEYQLNAIAAKYDIRLDDQRIKFIHESAELLSTLGSAVQREVYGHRVAEAGKIGYEAMKMEIDKAFKRRVARDKKRQEKIDLEPARARQPVSRSIRYDNIKSAMAEESVIALALRDATLLDASGNLTGESFSVPLLGRVYDQLLARHAQGLEVSLGVLADLTPEEMSHLTGISQRQQGPVSEAAFRDCVATIRGATQKKNITSDDDLLAFRNKLKERKGTK